MLCLSLFSDWFLELRCVFLKLPIRDVVSDGTIRLEWFDWKQINSRKKKRATQKVLPTFIVWSIKDDKFLYIFPHRIKSYYLKLSIFKIDKIYLILYWFLTLVKYYLLKKLIISWRKRKKKDILKLYYGLRCQLVVLTNKQLTHCNLTKQINSLT